MSATAQPVQPAAPPRAASPWRAVVIGSVAVLAALIGVAAGSFLLNSRGAGGMSPAAAYVPADAPFYVEVRLEPSATQDAALRELLGRFPDIEGVDLDRPLHEQLVEKIEETLAVTGGAVSYEADIAPWFGGTFAVAMTEFDATLVTDPTAQPSPDDVLLIASVVDPEAALATADRLIEEAEEGGTELTRTEHRGSTVFASEAGYGAFALTDDALLFGGSVDAIRAGLDVAAEGESLGGDGGWGGMTGRLPADNLLLGVYDMTDVMEASFGSSMAMLGIPADTFDAFLEGQPMRGAFALSAAGDALLFDAVTDAPTGRWAQTNAERGLADGVPADALLFADGGSIGVGLTALVEVIKEVAAADPTVAQELANVEAAIGADLEDYVSWIGDGAFVAGWDGTEPYGGMLIVPTDVEAARGRIQQLTGFARLAALEPSVGISVDDADVDGVTVTTIRWQSPDAADPMMPVPTGASVQVAVTDDRVVIGVGERFVGAVLGLDASDSLAEVDGYADAVETFGGANNTGVSWMDLGGIRDALVATLLPMAEGSGFDYAEVEPWLAPLDRLVVVTRLDGDHLVMRGGLLFD